MWGGQTCAQNFCPFMEDGSLQQGRLLQTQWPGTEGEPPCLSPAWRPCCTVRSGGETTYGGTETAASPLFLQGFNLWR